jgi:type II secretory pathway pseudopilin PulG
LLNMPKQSGQSLIEVLVALVVASLIIVALVTLVVASLRNAQFAQNQTRATKIAQEAIDQIRTIRDRDDGFNFRGTDSVQTFFVYDMGACGGKCYADLITVGGNTQLTETASGDPIDVGDGFQREIFFENYKDNEKKLTVKVYWTDASGEHESHIQTILTFQ